MRSLEDQPVLHAGGVRESGFEQPRVVEDVADLRLAGFEVGAAQFDWVGGGVGAHRKVGGFRVSSAAAAVGTTGRCGGKALAVKKNRGRRGANGRRSRRRRGGRSCV